LLFGSTAFLSVLVLAALAPSLWLAALFLMLGGFGTAAFASLQTGIVMMEAPVEARSRILGLTTTCIGTGPLGVLVLGALADGIGPPFAIAGFALLGLVFLSPSSPGDNAPAAFLPCNAPIKPLAGLRRKVEASRKAHVWTDWNRDAGLPAHR